MQSRARNSWCRTFKALRYWDNDIREFIAQTETTPDVGGVCFLSISWLCCVRRGLERVDRSGKVQISCKKVLTCCGWQHPLTCLNGTGWCSQVAATPSFLLLFAHIFRVLKLLNKQHSSLGLSVALNEESHPSAIGLGFSFQTTFWYVGYPKHQTSVWQELSWFFFMRACQIQSSTLASWRIQCLETLNFSAWVAWASISSKVMDLTLDASMTSKHQETLNQKSQELRRFKRLRTLASHHSHMQLTMHAFNSHCANSASGNIRKDHPGWEAHPQTIIWLLRQREIENAWTPRATQNTKDEP